MKLVFVNRFFHPDLAATSQLLSDLTFALAADGTEVHVVTSRARYDDPKAALATSEIVRRVRVHRVWTTGFGRHRLLGRFFDYLSYHVSAGLALWRIATPGDKVVVMTDPPLMAVAALPAIGTRGALLINWLQDLFPEIAARGGLVSEAGVAMRVLRALRNAALRRAAVNVVVCHHMRDRLFDQGVPSRIVEVVPNWADGARVHPVPAAENPLRAEWGLAGKFVVGHSGNLGRVHEVDTIGQAIEGLAADRDLVFLFIGGGAGYEKLRGRVEARGPANVSFRPYEPRERLHLSLSLPDVHLVSLAPAMEGLAFPSKLYGVLAAGRPALFVGARDAEAAQLLRDADCGIAVEAGQPEQLIEAIRYLKDRPERCREMGSRARAAFERAYDADRAIAHWRRLLLA